MDTKEIDDKVQALKERLARIENMRRDLERIEGAMVEAPDCERSCGRYFFVPSLTGTGEAELIKEVDEFLKERLTDMKTYQEAQLKRLLED